MLDKAYMASGLRSIVTVRSVRTVVRLVIKWSRCWSFEVSTGKCVYQPSSEEREAMKKMLLSR